MEIERIAATYAIIAGIAFITFWGMLYRKKDIPEITMERLKWAFHMGSDLGTAILLMIGGVGILAEQPWSLLIYYLSMGLTIYSLLNFSGYYGQEKNWPMFAFFLLLAIVAIIFVVLMLLGV